MRRSSSVSNKRLFIGNIPKDLQADEVKERLRSAADCDRDNVTVYTQHDDRSKNRGFAFLEFADYETAKRVKDSLSSLTIEGQRINVDWAQKEPEVEEAIMKQVMILYVRHLPMGTTEEELKNYMEVSRAANHKINRIKIMKDYAFVHYQTRIAAEIAMKERKGKNFHGEQLEITWAKPSPNPLLRSLSNTSLVYAPPPSVPLNTIPNVPSFNPFTLQQPMLSIHANMLNNTFSFPSLIPQFPSTQTDAYSTVFLDQCASIFSHLTLMYFGQDSPLVLLHHKLTEKASPSVKFTTFVMMTPGQKMFFTQATSPLFDVSSPLTHSPMTSIVLCASNALNILR